MKKVTRICRSSFAFHASAKMDTSRLSASRHKRAALYLISGCQLEGNVFVSTPLEEPAAFSRSRRRVNESTTVKAEEPRAFRASSSRLS